MKQYAAGLKPGTRVAVKRFTNKTLKKAGLEVPFSLFCFCGRAKADLILRDFVLSKVSLRVEQDDLNKAASFVLRDCLTTFG